MYNINFFLRYVEIRNKTYNEDLYNIVTDKPYSFFIETDFVELIDSLYDEPICIIENELHSEEQLENYTKPKDLLLIHQDNYKLHDYNNHDEYRTWKLSIDWIVETERIKEKAIIDYKELGKFKTRDYEYGYKKNIESGSYWVDTNGTPYRVGFAKHPDFAREFMKIFYPNDYRSNRNSSHKLMNFLHAKGWVRILGWNKQATKNSEYKPTKSQVRFLKEYCMDNGIEYKKFIY